MANYRKLSGDSDYYGFDRKDADEIRHPALVDTCNSEFPPFIPEESFRPSYYKPSSSVPLPSDWDIMDILQRYEDRSWEARSAIKYLIRAGLKSKETEVKDLTKAMEYIQRRLEFVKAKG